jgi:hypothetical protein
MVRARELIRWLRAPIWLLALATGAKSFADNPIIGSTRLNRRGLHVARLKLAHRLAWSRRRRLTRGLSPEWRENTEREGRSASAPRPLISSAWAQRASTSGSSRVCGLRRSKISAAWACSSRS